MTIVACPRCGEEQHSGADFCANQLCREYLAWDVQSKHTATTSDSQPTPTDDTREHASRPTAKASAVITLLGEDDREQPLTVRAGEQIVIKAVVRNQSDIVDRYQLAVEGMREEGWWSVEPSSVHLLPLDTGERYEQEIEILLHPPRSPEASAGHWPIEITATSVAHGARAASVPTQFEIAPFEDMAIEIASKPAPGRHKGCLKTKVTNSSNRPVDMTLYGSEEKDRARVSFAKAHVRLDPGGSETVEAVASPKKPVLVGRPVEHKLELLAQIADERRKPAHDDKPRSCTATYTQCSWLPWWTPRALAALLVVALAVAAYFVKLYMERVPVPNVRGHNISEARAELKAGHVKGVEKLGVTTLTEIPSGNPEHPNATVSVGDVYREVPEAGAHVAPGSEVTLYTAVRPSRRRGTVPNLYDLSSTAAINRLSAAGFAIGNIQPYPSPKGYLVVKQQPLAGESVWRSKKVVEVTLGQLAVVPDLLGQAPSAAAQKLSAVNLVIGTVLPRKPHASEVIAVQRPPTDRVVQVGTTINVWLGGAVPKLVGLTPLQARRALDAAGFASPEITPSSPSADYVIVRQSPAPKTIELTSTQVALVAGAPPAHHRSKAKHAPKTGTATNASAGVHSNSTTSFGSSADSTTSSASDATASAPTLGAVAAPEPSTACGKAPGQSVRPEPSAARRTSRARCQAAPRR